MKNTKVKAYGIALYKIEKNDIKLLLCKSVKSKDKWGLVKGVMQKLESPMVCARREFREESGIRVDFFSFEEYFEQKNKEKDVGVWLVNTKNVANLDKYFFEDKVLDCYLSWENSKIKFFSLKKLPKIKRKQKALLKELKDFLESKNQLH